jgi:hypothetical protein
MHRRTRFRDQPQRRPAGQVPERPGVQRLAETVFFGGTPGGCRPPVASSRGRPGWGRWALGSVHV